MITRTVVQSTVIVRTRFPWGDRITDSTLGRRVSARTRGETKSVIGFGMPIWFLLRKVRIPVVRDMCLSELPRSGTVNDGCSFFNNLVLLRTMLRRGEVKCLRRACTSVRESPTPTRPTVPQKLHGSADCLPFAAVLSFVVWAEFLGTPNPARNAATALPARLVAVGNYLRPLAEVRKRPASPFPLIQILDEEVLFVIWRRLSLLTALVALAHRQSGKKCKKRGAIFCNGRHTRKVIESGHDPIMRLGSANNKSQAGALKSKQPWPRKQDPD